MSKDALAEKRPHAPLITIEIPNPTAIITAVEGVANGVREGGQMGVLMFPDRKGGLHGLQSIRCVLNIPVERAGTGMHFHADIFVDTSFGSKYRDESISFSGNDTPTGIGIATTLRKRFSTLRERVFRQGGANEGMRGFGYTLQGTNGTPFTIVPYDLDIDEWTFTVGNRMSINAQEDLREVLQREGKVGVERVLQDFTEVVEGVVNQLYGSNQRLTSHTLLIEEPHADPSFLSQIPTAWQEAIGLERWHELVNEFVTNYQRPATGPADMRDDRGGMNPTDLQIQTWNLIVAIRNIAGL